MTMNHLDEETLSSALDGEEDLDVRAHLRRCRACRVQLEQYRMVAAAVATPVPPRPSGDVDRAVAAALDTALATQAGAERAGRAQVIPLFRRKWATAVTGAAAVAVLAAGITGALRRQGSSSHDHLTAADRAPFGQTTGGAPQAASGALSTAGGGGLDLGAQSDAGILAQLVRARLASPEAAVAPSQAGPRGPASDTASPKAAMAPAPACLGSATQAAGVSPDSPLAFVATLQWQGQPALVMVFGRSAPSTGLAGVVIRQQDCALLLTLPL